MAQIDLVPELRALEFLVKFGDGNAELVAKQASRDASLLVLSPDGFKLQSRVPLDGLLNLADVVNVELWLGTVRANTHVLRKALVIEGQGRKDLQRRRRDTALVDGGVLEQDAAGLFQPQLAVLGEEQVGTLDDVRNQRLAISDEAGDVVQVKRLGASAAGDEDVELARTQMESVAERGAVVDNLSCGKGHVRLVHEHAITLGRQLGRVKIGNHDTIRRQLQQLFAVQTVWIDDDTGAIDDGGVLFVSELDLVRTKIAVGAAGLQLSHGRRIDVELAIDSLDVLANRLSGHSIGVVRDTAELGVLACEERLPPRGTPSACVVGGPVDQVSGVLVGPHEQDLFLAVEVDDGVLDAGADGGKKEIKDTVDVLFKRNGSLVLVMGVEKDDTLGTSLGDVFVLALLGVGKVVILVEEGAGIDGICLMVTALDDPDATARDVTEAQVEASEFGSNDEEHTIQWLRVLMLGQEVRFQAETQGHLGGCVEVGLEDCGVEGQERGHDHLVVLARNRLGHQVL